MAVQPQVVGGRYELIGQIGAGGMGQVYEGFDRHLERRVAVKFTQPSLDGEPGWTKRFFREAKLMAGLRHPGLPAIYDIGLGSGESERPYLVMEFIDGITFDDVLAEHGPLPVGVVAALGAQTAAVLAAAHRDNIFHRDLKPPNLMLCADGTVKVLDFGLAVVLDADVTRYTTTGNTLGTPAFMAPEQIEGKQVLPQTDLYALGLVLHELLTGRRVMTGVTPFVIWQNQIHRPAAEIGALRRDVPADLAELIMDMLAKSPTLRPADASAVHDRLLRHATGFGELAQVDDRHGPAGMYARAIAVGYPGNPPEPEIVAAAPADSPVITELPADAPKASRDSLRRVMEQTRVLVNPGERDDVAHQLRTVIDAVVPELGDADADVVSARIGLADLQFDSGHDRDAAPAYRSLVEELTAALGPYDPQVLHCQTRLARCEARSGDVRTALQRLQRLHGQMAIRYGEQDRRVIELASQIRGVEAE
ncbi:MULTISPECIES: serine/threonine-protein kinase [unclassified Nocardia]|uniref:serine/threonine-protein kinase n=1 Tax=unclassified Nocardia TaxID=2637762 RepID=UPI0033ABC3C0